MKTTFNLLIKIIKNSLTVVPACLPPRRRGVGTQFLLCLYLFSASLSSNAVELITYYHNDLNGSPVAASDEFGDLLWREEYKPYGERILVEEEAEDNHQWYTGKPHDDDTGLTYMSARFYDPIVGRFMATDPVGFVEDNPTSFNRYAYANNNPYKYVDPDGRFPILIPIVVALVAEAINISVEVATRPDADNCNGCAIPSGVGIPGPPVGKLAGKLGGKLGGPVDDIITTKGAKGLETRGYKPQLGERTIQGQVDAATQAGNPTVQRGGQDLFRLRSRGHGQAGATTTPQNVRNVTPDGRVFTGKGADRTVTHRDIRELHKAQNGQGTSSIRTRSGR